MKERIVGLITAFVLLSPTPSAIAAPSMGMLTAFETEDIVASVKESNIELAESVLKTDDDMMTESESVNEAEAIPMIEDKSENPEEFKMNLTILDEAPVQLMNTVASGICGDNLTWTLSSSGTLSISGSGKMFDFSDTGKDNHPDTPWYEYRSSITSIIINTGVTSIGNSAFGSCSQATNVSIPNTVTVVGSGAFSRCTALTAVNLPNSIIRMDNWVFGFCTSLQYVNIPSKLKSIADNTFYDCSSLTDVTIPDNIVNIGSCAFRGCSNLRNIMIPNGVKKIEREAFSYCKSITSIAIPNSVTSLGDSAFEGCTSLNNISLSQNIQEFGNYVFQGIFGDNTAYYDNEENWKDGVLYIDNYLYKAKPDKISGTYRIKDGTVGIAYGAFWGCKELTEVTIPNSVKYIDDYVFYKCTNLNSITFPGEIDYIGTNVVADTAFYNNSLNWNSNALYINNILIKVKESVTSYTIKSGTKYIAGSAFYSCSTLSSVIIPNSVVFIGPNSFGHCTSLQSVTIPESVKYIGNGAFSGSSIKSIIIPDSVEYMGAQALWDCPELTEAKLSNNISTISELMFSVFDVSSKLSTVYIGNSVEIIENRAFGACSNLTDIYYNGSKTDWDNICIEFGNDRLDSATIHYSESYTVTYNYSYNGGASATKTTAAVSNGSAADLSPTATKSGWTFVGWNTDPNATTALSSYSVTHNVTLYAIYKKNLTAKFYSGANNLQSSKTVTIYNKATSGSVTAPTPSSYSGWTANGWRDDTTAGSYEYDKTAMITINNDKSFYAVYYRTLTLSYDSNGGSGTPANQTATQYYNAYGNKENKLFTISSTQPTKNGYVFNKWAKGSTNGALYSAGVIISINDNTVMYATWTQTQSVDRFTMLKDNYSFSNTWSSFGYGRDYRIPLKRYISVLGQTLGIQKYNESGGWGGSCYGMASSSTLFYTNDLDYTTYGRNANCLYDISAPKAPEKPLSVLIEEYQISQMTKAVSREKAQNTDDLQGVIDRVKYFEETGKEPIVLSVRTQSGGHAVVPYKCRETSSGRYDVYIYDNNAPNDTNRIVKINLNNNTYSYLDYNIRMTYCKSSTISKAMSGVSLYSVDDSNSVLIVSTNSNNVMIKNEQGISVDNINGAYKIYNDDDNSNYISYMLPENEYTIVNKDISLDEFKISVSNDINYQNIKTTDINATIIVGTDKNTRNTYAYIYSDENSDNSVKTLNSNGVFNQTSATCGVLGISVKSSNKIDIESDSDVVNCDGNAIFLTVWSGIGNSSVSLGNHENDDDSADKYELKIKKNTLKNIGNAINGQLSCTLMNNTDEFTTANIMVALYSANGNLLSILKKTTEIVGLADNYIDLGTLNYVGTIAKGAYIKLFAWEDTSNMKPLTKGYTAYIN